MLIDAYCEWWFQMQLLGAYVDYPLWWFAAQVALTAWLCACAAANLVVLAWLVVLAGCACWSCWAECALLTWWRQVLALVATLAFSLCQVARHTSESFSVPLRAMLVPLRACACFSELVCLTVSQYHRLCLKTD